MNKLSNIVRNRNIFKCGAIGGIAGAMGSVASAGISSDAAMYMNEKNIAMQRETNEQNYKMFHEQQDFAEKLWNQTNAYNSPEQIAQRLRDVGVNPLSFLAGQGGTMQTAGLQSSPQGAPAVAPQYDVNSASLMGQGIERAINSYFQNSSTEADTKLKLIDAAFRADQHREDLNSKRAEIEEKLSKKDLNESQKKYYLAQRDQIDQQITLYDTVWNDLVNQYGLNNEVLSGQVQKIREETTTQELQNEYQRIMNNILPKMNEAQLKLFAAQTSQAYTQANLNRQMTKTEKERTAREITNHQMDLFRKHQLPITQQLEEELYRANIAQVNAVTSKTRNSDNFMQNYSPLAGFTAGGAAILKAIK